MNFVRWMQKKPISIPPSLLISALGQVEDVTRCVSMDLKTPGNVLYQVGLTRDELGGSHFSLVEGLTGGEVPKLDAPAAKKTFAALHKAIHAGVIRACHDLSEGGLAVAAAEMAFAGGLGARINLENVPHNLPSPACGRGAGGEGEAASGQWSVVSGQWVANPKSEIRNPKSEIPDPSSLIPLLFSESNTRFLCEIEPERAGAFEALLAGVPHARIGEVTNADKLDILRGGDMILSANVSELKEAWQTPLRW